MTKLVFQIDDGIDKTFTIEVPVTGAETPPTEEVPGPLSISLSEAPASPSLVSGPVTMKVTGDQLVNVELYRKDTGYTKYGKVEITSPQAATITFDTSTVPDGTYDFQVAGFDKPAGSTGFKEVRTGFVTLTILNHPVVVDSRPEMTATSLPDVLPFGAGAKGWNLIETEDWSSKPVGALDLTKLGDWENKYSHNADFLNQDVCCMVTPAAIARGATYNPFSIVERNGKKWVSILPKAVEADKKIAAVNKLYWSGVLRRKLQETYSYREARLRFPLFKGQHCGFWTMNSITNWLPEVDLAEHLFYHGSNRWFFNLHWDAGGHKASGGELPVIPDVNVQDEVTIGCVVTPALVGLYANGKLIKKVTNPGINQPMHTVFDLEMGGSWAGTVDGANLQPFQFTDYKHYKMP